MAEILNQTHLDGAMPFDVDDVYSEDIKKFREYLCDTVLQTLCEWSHEVKLRWKNYEEELNRLTTPFENERTNWQLKGSLGSHLRDEAQARSLLDAAFWAQGTPNEYCLIQERSLADKKQVKLNDILESILYIKLRFRTTAEIADMV